MDIKQIIKAKFINELATNNIGDKDIDKLVEIFPYIKKNCSKSLSYFLQGRYFLERGTNKIDKICYIKRGMVAKKTTLSVIDRFVATYQHTYYPEVVLKRDSITVIPEDKQDQNLYTLRGMLYLVFPSNDFIFFQSKDVNSKEIEKVIQNLFDFKRDSGLRINSLDIIMPKEQNTNSRIFSALKHTNELYKSFFISFDKNEVCPAPTLETLKLMIDKPIIRKHLNSSNIRSISVLIKKYLTVIKKMENYFANSNEGSELNIIKRENVLLLRAKAFYMINKKTANIFKFIVNNYE